jgi:metallo-beta-lactamase family protein
VIQLAFHGAAGTVTGSKYLVSTGNQRVLVDCGVFQGPRELRQRNWQPLPFESESVDAVILTHAHVDHIGYLPRLIREGFQGKVYATSPTVDLAYISLLDSAHIQEEDAAYRNRKKLTRHKVALPLFTVDNAKEALRMLTPTPFGIWTDAAESVRFRFHVAGHILGAAQVELEVREDDRKVSVLFSGDVGRYGNPLTSNPAEPPACDYLICESTYGGRIHEPEDAYFEFEQLIKETVERKSILLIPAFAVSRTQQVTFLINQLIASGRVPPIDIHIDSPMAISATDVYCKYPTFHSVDISRLGGSDCLINGKNVHLHRKRKSSKVLNRLEGPAIILSASGMLTAGRILHHLINRLPDPSTTLLLVGFMAEGTLGRKIADGERLVYIHKQPVEVKAKVEILHGLSGHADYYELLHWLEPYEPGPRRVFITHGERSQSEAMLAHIGQARGWECLIPELDQSVQL